MRTRICSLLAVGAVVLFALSEIPSARAAYMGNTVEADTIILLDYDNPSGNDELDQATVLGGSNDGTATQHGGTGPVLDHHAAGGVSGDGFRTPDLYRFYRLTYGAVMDTANWTAETWIKWDTAGDTQMSFSPFGRRDGVNCWTLEYVDNGAGTAHLGSSTWPTGGYQRADSDSFSYPTPGAWYHLAIVGEDLGADLQMTFYLTPETNDTPIQIGQRLLVAAGDWASGPLNRITIGRSSWVSTSPDTSGIIQDDFKFSSTARTEFQSLGKVPEPATFGLLLAGIACAVLRRR